MRQRTSLLSVVFLAMIAAALGFAGWELAHTQATQRANLRARFEGRAPIATALIQSVFGLVNDSTRQDAGRTLGGPVTDADLTARVEDGSVYYETLLRTDGTVIASSAFTPKRVLEREASQPQFRAAVSSTQVGISDILDDGPAGVHLIETVVEFPGETEPRLLVTGSPVSTASRLLEGIVRSLAAATDGESFVLDGSDAVIASAATGGQPTVPQQTLLAATQHAVNGTYRAGGERYFASSRMSGTHWREVITVPTSVLYRGTLGIGRLLPWLVLALCAVALVAVAWLMRRSALARSRLAIANEQLAESRDRLGQRAIDLHRSNVDLERSNADLEAFAYVASHDLSAPLRAVSGFGQLLSARYKGRLDADADQFLGHMESSINRMQAIIDDLLSYSRVEGDQLRDEQVDLEAVLDEVLTSLDADLTAAHAEVTHDRLPQLRGDAGQLGLVLQNLVANAVKFTAPGVQPHVHVAARRNGAGWVIEVRDNGIGIAPEHREKIFKMFQRLHHHESYEGTGIGLSIVKKIAERHGGTVTVEPAPGGGSVFSFSVAD